MSTFTMFPVQAGSGASGGLVAGLATETGAQDDTRVFAIAENFVAIPVPSTIPLGESGTVDAAAAAGSASIVRASGSVYMVITPTDPQDETGQTPGYFAVWEAGVTPGVTGAEVFGPLKAADADANFVWYVQATWIQDGYSTVEGDHYSLDGHCSGTIVAKKNGVVYDVQPFLVRLSSSYYGSLAELTPTFGLINESHTIQFEVETTQVRVVTITAET